MTVFSYTYYFFLFLFSPLPSSSFILFFLFLFSKMTRKQAEFAKAIDDNIKFTTLIASAVSKDDDACDATSHPDASTINGFKTRVSIILFLILRETKSSSFP